MPNKPHRVHDRIDIKSLLDQSQWCNLDFFQSVEEFPCSMVEIDGKWGLAFASEQLCEPKYEYIIRLTHSHYLCQEQATCTLYEWDDERLKLQPLALIKVQGEVTLGKVLQALSESHPEAYTALSELLYKDPSRNAYVSYYRYFQGRVGGDVLLPAAQQRVILYDDFHTSPLDVTGFLTRW